MIIVSNLHWWTFRYWAVRATDAWGTGSCPKGKWSICTDFNLSSTKLHHINITSFSSSISDHLSSSLFIVTLLCVPLLSVPVPYIKNNNNKHQKEQHVSNGCSRFCKFLCEGILRQKHCPYLLLLLREVPCWCPRGLPWKSWWRSSTSLILSLESGIRQQKSSISSSVCGTVMNLLRSRLRKVSGSRSRQYLA
jgi:hypothetical protein